MSIRITILNEGGKSYGLSIGHFEPVGFLYTLVVSSVPWGSIYYNSDA